MSFKSSFFADFDTKERKVLVLLISIILIIVILLNIDAIWHREVELESWNQERLNQAALEIEMNKSQIENPNFQSKSDSSAQNNLESDQKQDNQTSVNKIQYFDFNPDTLVKNEWMELGFSEKQAQALENYSNAIDGFNEENFLASFVIDSARYKELKPYIKFQAHSSKTTIPNNSFEEFETAPILINMQTADTVEWRKLSGIGVVLSKRIIKYRNQLGGFSNKKQLLEVYGVSKEWLEKSSDQLMLDSDKIEKIQINKADYSKLKAHPYIDYNLSKSIVNYRKYRGNFVTVDDLFNIPNISEEIVLKLEPYLNFEND